MKISSTIVMENETYYQIIALLKKGYTIKNIEFYQKFDDILSIITFY
jgi:hypothetical protein